MHVMRAKILLQAGIASLLIAGAILWSSCGNETGVVGHWTMPADTARLSELWSQAAGRWNVNTSDAYLTDFVGLWKSDGTIFDLRVVALTPAGLELDLFVETPEGSSTTRVRTQLHDWSNDPDRSRLSATFSPPVADVLASIDSVTVDALASAASITVADGEFFTLWRECSWSSEQNADSDDAYEVTIGDAFPMGPDGSLHHYYSIGEGIIAPLQGDTLLSSLVPAEALLFARSGRSWDGLIQGLDNSRACFFVR
jgi:hypothetical protein